MQIKGLVSVLFVLGAIACGSITMSIDTEVKSAEDIVHTIGIEAEGPIAEMMTGSGGLDVDDIPASCEVNTSYEKLSIKCNDLPHTELGFIGEGQGQAISISVSENDEYVEYTARMLNTFVDPDQEAELQNNPFGSVDDIIKFRVYWNVAMPGEFVESASNADSYEDGIASFTITLEDDRDVFTVVSRKKKGGGLFSCN
ncbi:MAG: hypothetical protein F4Y49_03605 [Dehalococcoidia bacterium]|nr:hypothetical protein [Dehalococcoidia bacterium]